MNGFNSTLPILEPNINIFEFIFSGLSLTGTVTSFVNTMLFFKLRLKDNVYIYYLISSIVDFSYMFIISFDVLLNCGTPCDLLKGCNLGKIIYTIVLDDYLTSCLAIYNLIVELFITIQRYFLISKQKSLQNQKPFNLMLLISIVSLVYYSPVLFLKKIIYSDSIGYQLVYTNLGNSNAGRIIPIFLSIIRLFIGSCLLLIINIFTVIKFKVYLKEKNLIKAAEFSSNLNIEGRQNVSQKEKTEKRAKKNVTQMIIMVAFNYSFGTIPYALYYGLNELLQNNNSFVDSVLYVFGNFGIRLLIIFKIVIFYKFNKVFRQKFRAYREKIIKKARKCMC